MIPLAKTSFFSLFFATLLLAGILMLMPFMAELNSSSSIKYFPEGSIEGVEVVSKGIRSPLSFQQQKKMLYLLNAAEKLSAIDMEGFFPSGEIIIYRFDEKPLSVVLFEGLADGNLLFVCKDCDVKERKFFADKSRGQLKTLLTATSYEN